VTVALLESKHQSVVLENNRLTSDAALHKEQLRRLWKRVVISQVTSRSEKQAAARALQKVAPTSSSSGGRGAGDVKKHSPVEQY
jgi:hypothetical protein